MFNHDNHLLKSAAFEQNRPLEQAERKLAQQSDGADLAQLILVMATDIRLT